MSGRIIVHVSESNISRNSGMGRVEYYWRKAFKERGIEFVHIGPNEIGSIPHKSLFPLKAFLYFKKLKIKPLAIISHEPSALYFINKGIPCFLESHGIERRGWEQDLNILYDFPLNSRQKLSIKTKILFPIWRLYSCDISLKKAYKLLLINNEDKAYAIKKYNRNEKDIYLFRNGIFYTEKAPLPEVFTVLFNGSWLERKGISVLINAAIILKQKNIYIRYLLIGSGKDEKEVLADWPEDLRDNVTVIKSFLEGDEQIYLNMATVVVLPSFFEGQPLSILQAMASGKCCITTNNCGQKDFIENLYSGLLFETGSYSDLALIIERCFYDLSLVEKIGGNARHSVQDRTWENVSNEVVDYILSNISRI